jgi:hypothetical protein
MFANCQVTIKNISGNQNSKSLVTQLTAVNALILPASDQVLALYPNLPIGQTFSLVVMTDGITSLPTESELSITDAMQSELVIGQKFSVKDEARKNKVNGQFIFTAMAVRVA